LGRLAVFDKRGVGLSDPMTDWARSAQEQWAEDLLAVIEAANLHRPVVVSWEPFGAARFAISARPDLFASMVLINPSQSTGGYVRLATAASDQVLPTRTIEEMAFPSLRQVTAVLFTDLVDSTRRALDAGDAHWRDLLDEHDRTVERSVRHHGGRVVKYTGDGVLALMPSATGGLEAAQSIHDDLAEQGLRVRVGIHVGDVDERGDDVSGLAVNIAARIMSHAEAGETLVSETTRQATLGSGHHFADAGTTELRGIPEHWKLYRWLPQR
jgi:class 3 adenylate cyclase